MCKSETTEEIKAHESDVTQDLGTRCFQIDGLSQLDVTQLSPLRLSWPSLMGPGERESQTFRFQAKPHRATATWHRRLVVASRRTSGIWRCWRQIPTQRGGQSAQMKTQLLSNDSFALSETRCTKMTTVLVAGGCSIRGQLFEPKGQPAR